MATSSKRARKSSPSFDELPDEVMMKIFKYLKPQHVATDCISVFQQFVTKFKEDFYSFHDFSGKKVHYNDLKKCIEKNVEYLSLEHTDITTEKDYKCIENKFFNIVQQSNDIKKQGIKYLNVFAAKPKEEVINFFSTCNTLEKLCLNNLSEPFFDGIIRNSQTLQVLKLMPVQRNVRKGNYQWIEKIEKITNICTSCVNLKELGMGYALEDMMYWDSDCWYQSRNHHLNPESDGYEQDNPDFPLDNLFNNLPTNLEALDVANFQIKDRHLKLITERCPKLKYLDLTETFITTKSLDVIKDELPGLRRFSVSSMWIGTPRYQALFEQGKMPRLKYFWPLKKVDDFGTLQNLKSEIEKQNLVELFPNVNLAEEAEFRIAHPNPKRNGPASEGNSLWEKPPDKALTCELLKPDFFVQAHLGLQAPPIREFEGLQEPSIGEFEGLQEPPNGELLF